MKICTFKTCSASNPQPLSQFYSDNKSPDGLRSSCKTCMKEAKQRSYLKNPQKHLDKLKDWKKKNPDKVREGNLRNNYGITLAKYEEMLASQGGCCATCGTDKPGGNNNHFCVDHCHKTSLVRGILCYNCNIALGMIKDDILVAKKIADYLEQYEKVSTI